MNKIIISILSILLCIAVGYAAISYEDEFNNQAISATWTQRNGTGGNFA